MVKLLNIFVLVFFLNAYFQLRVFTQITAFMISQRGRIGAQSSVHTVIVGDKSE